MNLAEKISDFVEKWDIVGLSSEIKKEEHQDWIRNNAWDLIPILVEPANQTNLKSCPQVVHTCSQVLSDYVAQLGNPKEIIICLLEQCEHSGCPIRFRHCLPGLEVALLKLDLRGASVTWDWALRTVIDHITDLEIPDLEELDGDERLVFEHDPDYSDRLRSCEEATHLLKSLARRHTQFEDGDLKLKLKGFILWSCIQILGKPLSFLNVCVTPKGNSTTAKVVCDELIGIIFQLTRDQVKLIDLVEFCHFYHTSKMLDSDISTWSYGIGNLFHCLFAGKDPNLPLCYAPLHVYMKLLNPIISMLQFTPGLPSSPFLRLEKALYLCQNLLIRLPKMAIPNDALDMENHGLILMQLYQVIIYHELESLRKLAFQVYNQYFDVFGSSGKNLTSMVKHTLEKSNHSGLMGHAIGKLKNGILNEMRIGSKEISGSVLQGLVRKFCHLKNGAETDLLEISDEVMGSLNFLICILLRDNSNSLGLWDIKSQIETDYINPLTMGLSMSRAHYKLKSEESQDSVQGDSVSLMVGGKSLPQMSQDQMKEVIQSALNTFDMIECVLCRLKDVLNKR